MKILKLEECSKQNGIIIKAFLANQEFIQLEGYLDNLVLFASKTLKVSSRAIKTGARHSFARYLLLPIKIRRAFKTCTHDLDNIKCSAVEYKEELFVVYSLQRKGNA